MQKFLQAKINTSNIRTTFKSQQKSFRWFLFCTKMWLQGTKSYFFLSFSIFYEDIATYHLYAKKSWQYLRTRCFMHRCLIQVILETEILRRRAPCPNISTQRQQMSSFQRTTIGFLSYYQYWAKKKNRSIVYFFGLLLLWISEKRDIHFMVKRKDLT